MRDGVFTSPVEHDVRDLAAVRRELWKMPNFVGSVGGLAWAKERGCPWEVTKFALRCWTYSRAGYPLQKKTTFGCIAAGGNVEVAEWARQNGLLWNEWTCGQWTCDNAAEGGHLEMLQWARANGCPWDARTCAHARGRRSPADATVGARERLPVGRGDLRPRRERRPHGRAGVGESERLPVALEHLRICRGRRPPGGVEVGARGRLPVGQGDLQPQPRMAVTWRCCSGRARKAARGTWRLAPKPREAATSTCLSGYE